MARRRMGIIVSLLCLCLYLFPCHALAVSTADAKEPISTDQNCALTISYHCEETTFSGIAVKLYKIADVSADFQYTLTSPFVSSGLALNGIQSTGEWNVIRSTLDAHILACSVQADAAAVTDQAGQVCFDAQKPGLYLAVSEPAVQNSIRYAFDSVLVSLPGLGTDGLWQYQISVSAKPEIIPPTDKDIPFKILKLWKGDDNRTDRPQSIEVDIFRDGILQQTVTLSEDNHWSYSWTAKDDGATWTVAERNTPSGYTATVEEREAVFILTNTWTPDHPDMPDHPDTPDHPNPPKTGDTANIFLYVVLMYVSGSMLIILAIIGKKQHK